MKVQVYYNTWTCSMFPDLVGELRGPGNLKLFLGHTYL